MIEKGAFSRGFFCLCLVAALLSFSTARADTNEGVAGWWKFNENSGTAAADSSSSPNPGVLNNNAAWTGGKIGNAATLDGVDDYISAGDPASGSLDFGTASFSYGLWVNVSSNIGAADMPLFKGGSSAGTAGYDFELGTGAWVAHISDGTTQATATLAASGTNGQWKHVFAVVDRGKNTLDVYLDGILVNSASISGMGSVSNASSLTFGTDNAQGNDFAGLIDDARIYNRALNADEIRKIYGEGLQQGLVGWWKLDESAGTSAADSSASGNAGSLTNGPVWQSTGGKINGGLQFDGADDYVNIGDPAGGELDFGAGSSFTYGGWVYFSAAPTDGFLLSKGGSSAGTSGYMIGLGVTAWNAKIGDGVANVSAQFTGAPPQNQWVHLMAVVDRSSQKLKVYLNGAFVTQSDISAIGSVANTRNLAVGSHFNGTFPSNAKIDDVRIYSRALSAEEISALYTGDITPCRNPDGSEGEIVWNRDYAVPQYCDGTEWVAMRAPRVSSSGLQAWWRLDSATGSAAIDSSGNGYTGTLINNPTWNPSGGKIKGALQFATGFDHAVSHSLTLPKPVGSISLWVNSSNLTGDRVAYYQSDGTGSGAYNGYGDGTNILEFTMGQEGGDGTIQVTYQDGTGATGAATILSTAKISASQWKHIVVTWNTAGSMDLYIDGVLDSSVDMSSKTFLNKVASYRVLGNMGWTDVSRKWSGYLDDVRVYNRVLTTDEISALYGIGNAGGCLNPAGTAGMIIYNGTHHAVQFCDGAQWNALSTGAGPGGGTCSNPAGDEGAIIYNAIDKVVQWCNGANWIAFEKP